MRRLTTPVAFVIVIGLLVGIFLVLMDIGRNGLTLNMRGKVELADPTSGLMGKVSLVMEEPVNLIATGPDKHPIPANLSVVSCPRCGGSMVPIRWYPLTGEIEWICLECDYTTRQYGEP